MNKIEIIVLSVLVSFGTLLFAQEKPMELTINEAVDYALQLNRTLQNAKDDVRLASEEYKEARGVGLPSVEGSASYSTNFNYEFEFSLGSGSSEPPDIDYSVLDAGDYEVLNSISQMFGSSEGSTIVMEDQANASVQVSQLIFSGQYWVGLQMAKLGKSIRETSLKTTELDIKEQVINSYYLILISEKLLRVINENENNLNEIYIHTNNMYKVGMAEQTDVDQIRINLSQLENSKNEMQRNLQLNYNMFRFVIGVESSSDIKLTDNLDDIVKIIESTSIQLDSLNLTNNPTYQLMETQEKIGEKQVNMQKWAYTPTLAGYYNHTEKLLTSAFDLSPKDVAGLSLSIPIFSGGTKKAQVSQAKIELDKIRRNKSLLEEQLQIQDKQLTFELKNAYDNYLTQKENVEVAQRVYTSFQNKYKQGMVSSLELTQANSNYLQAESNYVSAVMTLLQSKLSLDKLYNKL